MSSLQTLSEADRRIVAVWAADCAERVLFLFEDEAPTDGRPRDALGPGLLTLGILGSTIRQIQFALVGG